MSEANIHRGDCLEVLRSMPDGSVDAIVTDPPYGLSFMGKKWDYDVPSVEIWVECLRVLKPGGHLLAFAGTRTQHRMAVRIEDAGFEIRDMIAWVYGSGFPKSLDVSKAIDKAAGAKRSEVIGTKLGRPGMAKDGSNQRSGFDAAFGGSSCGVLPTDITAPATDAARQWAGWGTALKPALEPITVARKPLVGTVAANVLEHGTGALNVDGGRVGTELLSAMTAGQAKIGTFERGVMVTPERAGRWPANLIHDGSDEVVACFPANAGASAPVKGTEVSRASVGRVTGERDRVLGTFHADSGSAARFFYCAKASKADRDEGNNHPTVKPTDLMRYLCRLVTPPGGVVLDPFTGSGSTGKAAVLEGFRFIGIERDPQYIEIARARVAAVRREPEQAVLI
jgi:DNA modification methylase